jgi:hypothetical protein
MRLKYKLGFFISFFIVAIGLMFLIAGKDKEGVIIYLGLALFGCSGVFYLLKDKFSKNIQPNWLKLIGYVLIIVGVAAHFIYQVDTELLVIGLSALLNPLQKILPQSRTTTS